MTRAINPSDFEDLENIKKRLAEIQENARKARERQGARQPSGTFPIASRDGEVLKNSHQAPEFIDGNKSLTLDPKRAGSSGMFGLPIKGGETLKSVKERADFLQSSGEHPGMQSTGMSWSTQDIVQSPEAIMAFVEMKGRDYSAKFPPNESRDILRDIRHKSQKAGLKPIQYANSDPLDQKQLKFLFNYKIENFGKRKQENKKSNKYFHFTNAIIYLFLKKGAKYIKDVLNKSESQGQKAYSIESKIKLFAGQEQRNTFKGTEAEREEASINTFLADICLLIINKLKADTKRQLED